MTRIKMCGIRRPEDIAAVNEIRPEYIGFVFYPRSRRAVTPEEAAALKAQLAPGITAVGVFVDEEPERVADLLNRGIITMAQLHGREDKAYTARLRQLTDAPLIRAFRISSREDLSRAEAFPAEHLLLDAGAGDGKTFDWSWLSGFGRPFFLAGGLTPENVPEALRRVHPFAVDVSSGIETDGVKDIEKMRAFAGAVRKKDLT